MGKSVPSAARLQDIASRIITSDRIKQTKKPLSNKTRIAPPQPEPPKTIRIIQSQKQQQQQQQKSKIIMEDNNNKLINKRVPLKDVVLECTRRWFGDTLKEAESGDVNMQVLVGQMFCSGYGVVKDAHKGQAWIRAASRSRSSVWKVGDKRPGYNASDSDSDEVKAGQSKAK
ncbi:Tetratricopeptide-like helical [Artemisia annua]|uniref:Tetratricopeptide-like helical n=1 Tax=Artemisia annua TaxID=35608 RepID=A0A2U1MHM5_ARTAN|nr:Tetratricopeptide-like helical [Artemisia annua]